MAARTFLPLILAGALPLWGSLSAAEQAGKTRPNIILFYADDLGYTDLSCQGSDYYRTPHIDRLAREAPSLRFPFLILHDPEDAICKFSGSERLHKLAATPADDKSLVHMKGMKHDLITNCTQKVAD